MTADYMMMDDAADYMRHGGMMPADYMRHDGMMTADYMRHDG